MSIRFDFRATRTLPFDAPIIHELDIEYLAQPLRRRINDLRKAWQRELGLFATGQAKRRVPSFPDGPLRLLWIYNWSTVGDAVMDLAMRAHLPRELQIDLLIAPSLAPLYTGDPAFRGVFTRPEDISGDHDAVLLQDLSSLSISLKRRLAASLPFASMFGHLRGERFDRQTFAQRRAEQLFRIPIQAPAAPALVLRPRLASERTGTHPNLIADSYVHTNTRIAVALGARDVRRWYRRWPELLACITSRWPALRPPPRFVLLGTNNANADVAQFNADFLKEHCELQVDRLDLLGTASAIMNCHAFLGPDGGLMHIAVALDKPGLGLFVEIDPRMRLLPGSRVKGLRASGALGDMASNDIAEGLLAALT